MLVGVLGVTCQVCRGLSFQCQYEMADKGQPHFQLNLDLGLFMHCLTFAFSYIQNDKHDTRVHNLLQGLPLHVKNIT